MSSVLFNVTEEGALVLWPGDVSDLVFGPALTLEQAAEVEAMLTAAVAQRRRFLEAEEDRAKVTDLDEHRKRRGATPRRHRRTS